jgi:PPK2 family polyphosphate:nucleotide phosphotransferase
MVGAPGLAELLRVGEAFRLADVDPASTPGFTGGRTAAQKALAARGVQLLELQERLWAESRYGGRRRILLVLQGMDTSGKDGIIRHVVRQMNPQGVRLTAFKAPTAEERRHDFLWRVRRRLPGPGEVGVFNRSHYEDVLIVRVHGLVARPTWQRRYAAINRFEDSLVGRGTTIVKVMLHLSKEEQKRRLTARLDRPDKQWKYNPRDVDERTWWEDYQAAYDAALCRCSTPAPWHVVPADRKWYARWAVQQMLLDTLTALDPQWPVPPFDMTTEKARLEASD